MIITYSFSSKDLKDHGPVDTSRRGKSLKEDHMYFENNKELIQEPVHNNDTNSTCIMLDTVEKIKDFVNTISSFSVECDLTAWNKRYTVDAKSIMGIFSLDLSRPVRLSVYSNDPQEILKVMDAITPFIMK